MKRMLTLAVMLVFMTASFAVAQHGICSPKGHGGGGFSVAPTNWN
jgi:hypothetical protein